METPLLQLAQGHRPRRAGEWTEAKAVTFIVTLAASRSVTLAASRADMSRKSAYALKRRDPGFALAWDAAVAVTMGDKVDEVDDPRFADRKTNRSAAVTSRVSDAERRDKFFAALARPAGDSQSSSLARARALP